MKKCCKETFKRALEEVLFTIKANKPDSIEQLKKGLEYAVELLEKQENA